MACTASRKERSPGSAWVPTEVWMVSDLRKASSNGKGVRPWLSGNPKSPTRPPGAAAAIASARVAS